MNRRLFETYVETQLAPTLRLGDMVILDNLSSHKSEKARAILKERGAWFLVVMWFYSAKLFVIAVLAIPCYIAVAVFITGPLRARIEEKFERSAANNALLVESIGGIQTVKAGAVEPQWQDRWERQLAGYSFASQKVINLGNTGSQLIQLISKINMVLILYFGAKAVIDKDMTVGALVAFNMFAQRVSGPVILRREEVTKARQMNRFQRLVAPVDGTVQSLEVHTVGGVVEAAKPLMTVIPARGALEVQAKVLNKDIGFVRAGQEAAVKLEAFPFTRYGAVPGRVRSISRDAVQDKDLGLVYMATITLDRSFVDADGRRYVLSPGLSATVDVKTGTRRIVSYLISPLQTSISQAGRER